MQKIGHGRVFDSRKKGFIVLKNIFSEDDKSRAMIRLNGYRTACLQKKNPLGLKRANILKELMKTL